MNQFVDALMYLGFLGVTRATQKLINKWVKITKRNTQFNVIRRHIFEPISDMKLEWCKLIDTESGWISDN